LAPPEQAFPAPAKLNLMLRVVGRRSDGYHLLQTVFQLIDYGDTVRLRLRDDGIIRRTRDMPGVTAEEDLAVRAARVLQRATGTHLGADIAVEKRIPLGGGLGGGSSDAATVLLALNSLWKTDLTRPALLALAAQLGADVPVFVFGENAFGGGIGEQLTPLALLPSWYVVLTPAVSVSTARIFSHPDLKRDSEIIRIQGFSVGTAVNDLQSIVCREYPEVARYLAWLAQHGQAMMTGSGAGVFAPFESEHTAQAVLARLPEGMSGFVARGLQRHPLHGLAS
jgi:4-diphosphocytidyl-2-C-methyl-D-erythritol kinase